MKKISLFLLLFIAFLSAIGKDENYPVSEIPESLKSHADAVIRSHSIEKEITSDARVATRETLVVTIFNKSAQNLGYFSEIYDKQSSVSDYSVKLYNSKGIQIYKSKKSDFTDIKAYDGMTLFDDNRKVYLNKFSNNYPYTVEISFKRIDKHTLHITPWFPVSGYNLAVQQSSYTITSSANNSIRYKEYNLKNTVTETIQKDKMIYHWELNGFNAIKWEPFMPYYEDVFPLVRIAPTTFDYDGFRGDMSTWESFGLWTYGLLHGRDIITSKTRNHLLELTKNVSSDMEKIRIVYKYLQDNTRYVNIAEGIGGWQPIEAAKVDETKYGDCKALSNYTKAMLKEVGIEAIYTRIMSQEVYKDLNLDFPSQQFNHIILCVLNHGDTVWLECTSQKNPFGFMGSSTQNRHCLLVTEQGGKIAKTPEYGQETNTQFSFTLCMVDEEGNFMVSNKTHFKGLQFENIARYFYLSPKEQSEALYKMIDLPKLSIADFHFDHTNEAIPEATMELSFKVENLGTKNSNRLFIPLNSFNSSTYIPEINKNRTYPIVIKSTGYDADTVIFDLPKTYSVEYLPEPVVIDSPFGYYQSSTKIEDNKATYIREYKWNKGTFPATEYEKLRDFFKAIAAADKAKIVLFN
ncbi:MAG: hypothetical protein CVU09_02565 [Bacteroidetes bacterium HGW-Bacteroidetes-4]|jgi:hypothetical protein|nr:MAG: hypothetical protein CVU09_02565 [Bacteroidetes bacterium HGW-Bacteroidetes-4]